MKVLFAYLPLGIHSIVADGEDGQAIILNKRSTPEEQAAAYIKTVGEEDDKPLIS